VRGHIFGENTHITKRQGKPRTMDVKALPAADEELLRALLRTALQRVLEAREDRALSVEKGARTAGRQRYRPRY
jgi:hypothetical protein